MAQIFKVRLKESSAFFIRADSEDQCLDWINTHDITDAMCLSQSVGKEYSEEIVERHEDGDYADLDICEEPDEHYEMLQEWIQHSFITDVDKMRDFNHMDKESFLSSYDYLNEEEYDATNKYLNWLKGE